jgi:hypothetical protein
MADNEDFEVGFIGESSASADSKKTADKTPVDQSKGKGKITSKPAANTDPYEDEGFEVTMIGDAGQNKV